MYKGKKVIQIVATGENGEIGAGDKLLWNIVEDMQFFRHQTLGHSLVMGSKTVRGMNSPLQRRLVSVVKSVNGKTHQQSLEAALDQAVANSDALNTDIIFIAGGASIYDQTIEIADLVYKTTVHSEFENADTFYKHDLSGWAKGVMKKRCSTVSGHEITIEVFG